MSGKHANESEVSLGDLFDILSHEYRRRILVALAQHNPRDEADITSASVATEHLPDEELEQLTLELYHTHLPKLADAGFVEWDRESGTITRGPRFEAVEPLLRLLHDHRDELPEDWP